MRLTMSVLALIFSFSVMAHEQKLAVITSDIDTDVYDFYIITNDDQQLDSLRYVNTTSSGQVTQDETVPAQTVLTDGVVLVERNGREAVRLKVAKDFSLESGGNIFLDYLFNGISGIRHIHPLKLQKIAGEFVLTDVKDQKINRLFVLGNWSRFMGLIGVREIRTSYKGFIE